MELYQFSLFFAALVICYMLVHIRLARFETYLKEVATLRLLNERLKDLADRMERVRVDRVEEGLHQLHEDLVEIKESANKLQQTQKAAPAREAGITQVIAPSVSPAERVRSAVLRSDG